MAGERAKADEENLRQTAFEKGEWANQPPTDLDVDYDLLSGALGTAGSPLMSITAETLLALSFCVDELGLVSSRSFQDEQFRRTNQGLRRMFPAKRIDRAAHPAEINSTVGKERPATRIDQL